MAVFLREGNYVRNPAEAPFAMEEFDSTMKTQQPITVLCAEDNADLAGLLHHSISGEPDMQSVCCLHDASRLVDEVERHRPHVAVIDLTMPGRDTVEVIRELRDSHPETRAVVFSGYDDPSTRDRAWEAGAWGFVSKHGDMARLFDVIRRVAKGEYAFDS